MIIFVVFNIKTVILTRIFVFSVAVITISMVLKIIILCPVVDMDLLQSDMTMVDITAAFRSDAIMVVACSVLVIYETTIFIDAWHMGKRECFEMGRLLCVRV